VTKCFGLEPRFASLVGNLPRLVGCGERGVDVPDLKQDSRSQQERITLPFRIRRDARQRETLIVIRKRLASFLRGAPLDRQTVEQLRLRAPASLIVRRGRSPFAHHECVAKSLAARAGGAAISSWYCPRVPAIQETRGRSGPPMRVPSAVGRDLAPTFSSNCRQPSAPMSVAPYGDF
jgi:hypothetical protein